MKREEERNQAMKDSIAETIYASGWGITKQATDLLECAFTKGAEWADKTMIDKACQWLKAQIFGQEILLHEEDIEEFRKAMEE